MANILEEVQQEVVAKLSADSSLSDCTFLVENRKDIDYQIKNALGRQGIVGVVMTPKAMYAGKYEDLFLAWQLDELEIDIVENPIVNRGKKTSYITGQDAAMRVFETLCPLSGDYEGQFNPVSYEEGEDSGLIVNRCILKALVYGEHGDTPQPEPGLNMQFVKLLDGPPSKPPSDGWMWPADGGFVIWQNGEAHNLGVSFNEMSSYVDARLSAVPATKDCILQGQPIDDTWTGQRKMSDQLVFKSPNSRCLVSPDGMWWAANAIQVGMDGGELSSFELSAQKQYSVDLNGNAYVLAPAYYWKPPLEGPLYIPVDDKTLALIFIVDGQGRYKVDAEGIVGGFWEHIIEQPFGQDVSDCDLDFEWSGHRFVIKADGVWQRLIPASEFIRDSMAINPGDEFLDKMSQIYLPLSAVDSTLSSKQDRLSDWQISAIDWTVGENSTQVKFANGAVSSYYVGGELAQATRQGWESEASSTVAEVRIGNAITGIGYGAFYGCIGLTSVTIPDSVTSVGNAAFQTCHGLTSVTIPDRVTSVGNGAFFGCIGLTSVTISNGVTRIGSEAFKNCTKLTSVTIPDSVTNIGNEAFRNCTKLTSVTIPDSVTRIGQSAFYNCSSLAGVTFRGRTQAQVQEMTNYPFGISDTSIVTTWNDASQEWTSSQLSGYALTSQLSGYLPLSGGTLQGSLEIPAQYDLSVGQYQLKDKDMNGFQIGDGWDFWKFSGSSEQPQDVMRRMDISAFPTTDEINATRVEAMTTIHESDWAGISAQASSSTLYIVIPD